MKAPKIIGDTWFNSKPLAPEDLRGKVVLVDFWTYSCVNCLRTLPHLRAWWRKYKEKDFLLIGVHTPEFEFEKDPKNVEQAIKDLEVGWPVVLDNDYINWNNFANHYWPAKYLLDKEGNIVHTHFGEGEYEATEQAIQQVLGGEELPELEAAEQPHGGVCFPATPETYAGYGRGDLANAGGYRPNEVAEYKAPETLPQDSIALGGKFLAMPEYVESAEQGAELILRFRATEVNLVMHAVSKTATAVVSIAGKPLPAELRGNDVNEASEVVAEKPRMYNLLKSGEPIDSVLSIRAKEGNFQAYAFTFSGCVH